MEEKSPILQGWKEIEDYVGLNRKTILKQGYPVRQNKDGRVCAVKHELLDHAMALPKKVPDIPA